MTYDTLYVIGDSYTTPGLCVSIDDSYWTKFGNHINANNVINHAHPGKNNRNMLRNAVRYVLENKNKKNFVLIGLTHLARIDYYSESKINSHNEKNGNYAELHIHNYDYNKQHTSENDKWFVSLWSHNFQLANLLTDIITTMSFFNANKIDYLIHNCSLGIPEENFDPLVSSFTEEVNRNLKVLNLYKDSWHSLTYEKRIKPVDFDLYEWFGHHGKEGNDIYYQYLKKKYDNIYKGLENAT